MNKFTEEKNTLMLLSLMKAHGIKKVIASPGTTNVALVASMQADPWFEIYSSVDERSAAYMACGMAAECGEPVALTCTQATASRNYFPGLTEAYYRKLPVLAITSTQHLGKIGQNVQQTIDRSRQPIDTVTLSVHIPVINTEEDAWACNVMINRALTELRRNGGGPVHINLTTIYSRIFNVSDLPYERVIKRISYSDALVPIDALKKVAIYVGAHKKWNDELLTAVNGFCKKYDAVVLCDQISNYKGRYRVNPCLLLSQQLYKPKVAEIDILIHIGDTSGAPTSVCPKEVWRVNPDGEIRDTFKKLSYVFEMEEEYFFRKYALHSNSALNTGNYLKKWQTECDKVLGNVPELPFSNAWIAQTTLPCLPDESVLHMGIYNSLRIWSYFELPKTVLGYANTGGFGIDGCLSSLIGASLCDDKIYYAVIGDLAFFYDMNSLGNRHLGKNLRILLINNGCGQEFKNPDNRAFGLGDGANLNIAAYGHYGSKSKTLVKHYAEDLGFTYISATNKDEYLINLPKFITTENSEKPILFEVFLDTVDETEALNKLYNIKASKSVKAKVFLKSILGEKTIKMIKKVIT